MSVMKELLMAGEDLDIVVVLETLIIGCLQFLRVLQAGGGKAHAQVRCSRALGKD